MLNQLKISAILIRDRTLVLLYESERRAERMTTVEELIVTISRFTPQQLDLFRSAAQQIVEQQQGQGLIRKSE